MADALIAHDWALSFGGLPGVRDLGSIDAAITRPYLGYYRSIEAKASALAQSVASNHGFIDGNKRTTFLLLILLIKRSGYRLVPIGGEDGGKALEHLILQIVERKMDQQQVIEWFGRRLRRHKE
jgi:death on curing protein